MMSRKPPDYDLDDFEHRKSKVQPMLADEAREHTKDMLPMLNGLALQRPDFMTQLISACGPWLRVHLSSQNSVFGEFELKRLHTGLETLHITAEMQLAFRQAAVDKAELAERNRKEAASRAAEAARNVSPPAPALKRQQRTMDPPDILPPLPMDDPFFRKITDALRTKGVRGDVIFCLKRIIQSTRSNRKLVAAYIHRVTAGHESVENVYNMFQIYTEVWKPEYVWAALVFMELSPEIFVQKWQDMKR